MIKSVYFKFTIITLLSFLNFSCEKDSVYPLEGTKWKLQSFSNTNGQVLTFPKPEDCFECYVLNFGIKGQWQGYSSTNVLNGKYIVDNTKSNRSLRFSEINGTEINELFDGFKYVQSLKTVHSYELKGNQLKLFYDDKGNLLIFNLNP